MVATSTECVIIRLATRNLQRAQSFYSAVGFEVQPEFSDAQTVAFRVGLNTVVLLQADSAFRARTRNEPCDTSRQSEALVGLNCATRSEVETYLKGALSAGGRVAMPPVDLEGRYTASFYDLDGHHWELHWEETAPVSTASAS